jgi:hypothetical protein
MTRPSQWPPCPFDASERDFIRREFSVRFGQSPRLADGIFLRTWRSGPQVNQPKVPLVVRRMLARGLLVLQPAQMGMRAFFTEAGFAALRSLAADRRLLSPQAFAHLHDELGLSEQDPSITA